MCQNGTDTFFRKYRRYIVPTLLLISLWVNVILIALVFYQAAPKTIRGTYCVGAQGTQDALYLVLADQCFVMYRQNQLMEHGRYATSDNIVYTLTLSGKEETRRTLIFDRDERIYCTNPDGSVIAFTQISLVPMLLGLPDVSWEDIKAGHAETVP